MYHLHVRYISGISKSSADSVRQYITREGRYAKRGDRVRHVHSINMPAWAGSSANVYWISAQAGSSRRNARAAYAIEFALPKDLPLDQQSDLALEFVRELCRISAAPHINNGLLPATFGIHEGYGKNPHAHVLLGTSIMDGLDRGRGQFFRRYNRTHPDRGGAMRATSMSKKGWLMGVRALWAKIANRFLKENGLDEVMDHRSHKARGLYRLPGLHLGPAANHMRTQGVLIPRLQRHQEIQDENQIREKMEIASDRSRVLADEMARQEEELQTRLRTWVAQRSVAWSQFMYGHPLTSGSAQELLKEASILVTESDKANFGSLQAEQRGAEFQNRLIDELGGEWDAVALPDCLCFVRPDSNQVVISGPGYIVSDGERDDHVAAVLKVARRYSFIAPVVRVKESLGERASELLALLKLRWRVKIEGASGQAEPIASPTVYRSKIGR